MTELAVFGSVALLALAFLIQIGLRANYQQEIEQDTFHRALQEARNEWNPDGSMDKESHSVQYYQFRSRELPDPGQGFAIMPTSLTQASSTVLWGKWKTFLGDDRDSQPKIIAAIDRIDDSDEPRSKFRSEHDYTRSNDFQGFDTKKNGSHVRRQQYRSGDVDSSKPFVAGIRNELISGGTIRQDNVGSSARTDTRSRHLITFNIKPGTLPAGTQPDIGSFLYSCNPLVLGNSAKHLDQQCD